MSADKRLCVVTFKTTDQLEPCSGASCTVPRPPAQTALERPCASGIAYLCIYVSALKRAPVSQSVTRVSVAAPPDTQDASSMFSTGMQTLVEV